MDGLAALPLADLLILALATLYAAFSLTKTHGMFGMFAFIRRRLPLGGLTACIVCAAFWCALGVYALWLTPLRPAVYVLAIAGAATGISFYVGLAQQEGSE